MVDTLTEVTVKKEGGIVVLSINRSEDRNMLSDEVLATLVQHLRELEAESRARVVVLTGVGDLYFCGGVFDPTQMARLTNEHIRRRRHLANEFFDRLEGLSCPVIAAVNGRAQAGGFEMALACDIRLAAAHATFCMPENTWGMFPGAGGPIRLPRLVGTGRAMEIIMTGRDVSAEEALRIGLVEHVVDGDRLQPETHRLASAIAATAPLGNRAVKKLVKASLDLDLRSARAYSEALRDPLALSADTAEGIAAFRESRSPRFKGA